MKLLTFVVGALLASVASADNQQSQNELLSLNDALKFCKLPGCYYPRYDYANREVCDKGYTSGYDKKDCLVYDCESESGTYDNKNRIGYAEESPSKGYCCQLCSQKDKCVAWSFAPDAKGKECSLYWYAEPSYASYDKPEYRSKYVNQCHLSFPKSGSYGEPECKGSCKKYGDRCYFDKHSYDCSCAAHGYGGYGGHGSHHGIGISHGVGYGHGGYGHHGFGGGYGGGYGHGSHGHGYGGYGGYH